MCTANATYRDPASALKGAALSPSIVAINEVYLSSIINDFSMTIATVNGSGSQSANNILLRTLFRMGVPVSGKNLFPSNIAGLPTWFSIRANDQGFVARQKQSDIFVAMNKETLLQDQKSVKPGGFFIYNSSLKTEPETFTGGQVPVAIDFNQLTTTVTSSIQLKKLLVNMVYVGVLTELLQIPDSSVYETIEHQFKGKESIFKINKDAVAVGIQYAVDNLKGFNFPWKIEKRSLTQDQILIDGNSAGALGMVYAGCTFASWYPITPSSSLAENFESYCNELRTSENGEKRFTVVQAEDELSAISMVAGAGWAGSRAMTATSGPGISLMSEAVGLMYFAEIPGVIWDVQRMGPSTGLPTRTSQGDILAAVHSSHGDTRHPVYLPSSPNECFDFANLAFDLADRAQTLVFVLSDLDLGMNYWMSDRFQFPEKPMDRGKILNADDLVRIGEFARYKDVDGDGIPYRTLPGTPHDLAAYFTRGTGHTPEAKYSESAENYQDLLIRLDRKWETIKTLVPEPEVQINGKTDTGIIFYGSTKAIIDELVSERARQGETLNWLRLKCYPFHTSVEKFINDHKEIVVIEQNQHGQMTELLRGEFPQSAAKISVLTHCDGLPLSTEVMAEKWSEYVG